MTKAILLGHVKPGREEAIVSNLKEIAGQRNVTLLYGKYDFIAELSGALLIEKLEKIKSIQGLQVRKFIPCA